MYQSYVLHCKSSNKFSVSDNIFGSHLVAKEVKKERRIVNSTREYCYIGVSISQMAVVLPRLSRLPPTYEKV
jgi:hypothetical protein